MSPESPNITKISQNAIDNIINDVTDRGRLLVQEMYKDAYADGFQAGLKTGLNPNSKSGLAYNAKNEEAINPRFNNLTLTEHHASGEFWKRTNSMGNMLNAGYTLTNFKAVLDANFYVPAYRKHGFPLVNKIILHTTATGETWEAGKTALQQASEVARWHIFDNKWSDAGYNYCIASDGTIVAMRPNARVPAHTKGYNRESIGIVLVGPTRNSTSEDKFEDYYSKTQYNSLVCLVQKLEEVNRRYFKLYGHNDYAAKACPGFRVNNSWRNEFHKQYNTPNISGTR